MRHSLILTSLLALGCQAPMDEPTPPPADAPRPSIGSISPPVAASTGGEALVIRGAGFSPRAGLSIAGVPVEKLSWVSPTELRAEAPARLGTYGPVPVAVTNPDGGADTRTDMFSYFAGVVQFRPNQDYAGGVAPVGVRLLDLNDDGRLDLVAAYEARGVESADAALSVLFGRGDGTFAFGADYKAQAGLSALAVGDVTGDGRQDLVAANGKAGSLSVYPGQGGGAFGTPLEYPTGAYPVSVLVADLNGDGRQDLASANAEGVSLTLLLSQKDGGLQPTNVRLTSAPWAIAAGDVSGDGKIDLVVTSFRRSEITLLLGDGRGGFSDSRAEYETGASPYAVALGDLDNDRKLDIVVANRASNTLTVLLGKGDGTFSQKGSPYVGNAPFGVTLGDVNGDQRLDVLVPCYDLRAVGVLIGQGDGRFAPVSFYPSGSYTTAAALGDVNGDKLPDAVVGNGNATYSVLLNSSL